MNRIVAMWMIFCMMISCFGVSVAADEDSDIQTNGNISFEGFTFNYREDNSIQATADVYVENLAMTTMTIGLKYHDYIVPSNLDTNIDSTDVEKVFKVTDENDVSKYFQPYGMINPTDKTIFILLTLDQALAENDFKDAEVDETDVITNRLYSHPDTIGQWHINACSPEHKKVKIGTISFKVTDSAQLIKVPQDQIEARVLESIQASENELFGTAARYSSGSSHYDALVTNSSVTITIDAQRTDASATVPRNTVSAYTLYKSCSEPSEAGTINALYDYINRNMSRVKVTKASGTQSIGELIKWTHTDSDAANNAEIKCVDGIKPMTEDTFNDVPTLEEGNYDPKGNKTYMIKQRYMKDPEQIITIFLTVTPSELTGFEYDRRNMVFGRDEQSDIDWEYLKMPDPVTAVVTGVDDEYVPPTYEPVDETQWKYNHDGSEAEASEGVTALHDGSDYPITARFTTKFPEDELTEPWLTIPEDFDYTVNAYRYVIDNTEVSPPKDDDGEGNTDIKAEIIYNETDLDVDMPGTLEITVKQLGGANIAENTKFNIYLPNGWVLSSEESYVDVEIHDGTATIRVNAMDNTKHGEGDKYNEAQRREIQSLINLGSKNTFRLSEVLPNDYVVESPLYRFSFEKRVNRYLDDDTYFEYYVDASHKLIAPDHVSVETDPETDEYIEKDFSDGRAGLFTIYKGQSLKDISSYLEFPDDSTIPVMYHGKDGYQPAELGAAKVKKDENGIAWRILGNETVDAVPADQSGDITLVGTLEEYSYTNFDNVTNPQNVKLYLKLTPIDPPSPSESPDPDASPTPDVTPDPDATPDPNASPTPVPGEAIEISTKVPPGDGSYKVVMNNKTFRYDTKQAGYNPSQRQTFTIKNIGSVDIAGLTMRIADITDAGDGINGSAANFTDSVPLNIMNLAPDKTLTKLYSEQYNEIDVELRPLMSLPEGTYKARVIVGSRMNDDLAHFDIEFKVVSEDTELYTVTVDNYKTAKDSNSGLSSIGVAYLTDESGGTVYSRTFEANDTVYATVVVLDNEGYTFDYWQGWNTVSGTEEWSDESHTNNPLSFQMPAHDVTIKPVFAEKTDLYLRLADLEDYTIVNMSDRGQDRPNPLRDTPTNIAQFDETIHTYYVVVDYPDEDNYVKFGLKNWDNYEQMNYTVTLRYDGETEERDIKDPGDTGTPNSGGTVMMHKSQDFKLKEGHNFVTITTTYKEGDTEYEQTYKIIIHRRKAEVDVLWRPGNSPYGLIAAQFADKVNSENPTEAAQAQADELEAKQRFTENHSFIAFDDNDNTYTNKYTPLTAINTYNTYYSAEAWNNSGVYTDSSHSANNKNYDESDEALFVYNKTVFVDPGFVAVYNDEGSQVSPENITREISNLIVINNDQTLTAEDLVDPNLMSSGKLTRYPSIKVDSDGSRDKADGSCVINELENLNVLPGVYSIVYKFSDETGLTSSFERPLIVLPEKGDVNIDGTVDQTDTEILYNRLNNSGKSFFTEVINGADAWKQLLSYRVGDTNEDRNVNSIDANAAQNKAELKRYYEPLPTEKKAVDAPAESEPKTVWPGMPAAANGDGFTYTEPYTIPEDKPTLVLDYLGDGDIPQNKKVTSKPETLQDKKVWFGVGIKDPQKLRYFVEKGIYSLDVAIDYDEDILVPCDENKKVKSDSDFDYAAIVKKQNIAASGDAGNHDVTLWNNAELYESSLQTDLNLSTEDYGGDTKEDRYKSVFVTIRSKDGTSLRLQGLTDIYDSIEDNTIDTDTIYLLRVPFLVKEEPQKDYTGLPITINGITEQTFVMSAEDKGAPKGVSWEGENDKTTANLIKPKEENAFNHFNGIDVQDLFGTDYRFTLKGSIHGWNPLEPFKVKFYRQSDDGAAETLYKTFTSIENDLYANGKTTVTTAEGEVTWDYELHDIPVATYRVQVEKQSHITYPNITVKPDDVVTADGEAQGTVTESDTINLIVGDINNDTYIKDVDRAYLIHTFNKSRPWTPELTERFDRNDLNGDRMVNMFDLNLLNRNYERVYSLESSGEEGGDQEGGGKGP